MKRKLYIITRLYFGFFICALGISLMLLSDLGMPPWATFHKGVSMKIGLSYGRVSQLTGFVIIVFSLLLDVIPGIATVLNMIFIGYFVDIITNFGFIATPDNFMGKLVILLLGMLFMSIGIYFYISNNIGAGPRDGLMIGLIKKTGYPVKIVKTTIEVTILFLGILLGGPYGVGTIISALGMGYLLDKIFKIAKYNPHHVKHKTFADLIKKKSISKNR